MEEGKRILLNIATPDSVFRAGDSAVRDQKNDIFLIYFEQQQHTSINEFLVDYLHKNPPSTNCHLIQVCSL